MISRMRADTSRQNFVRLLKRLFTSCLHCRAQILESSGYHVRIKDTLQAKNYQILIPLLDSAFHLTSTATLLVRCALETTDQEVARSCMTNVDNLRSLLRRVRDEEDWDVADMCLDHCERILNRYPEISTMTTNMNPPNGHPEEQPLGGGMDETLSMTPAAIILPETTTNNDIVEDMMSISGTFGTMDGFPFDMTGIWDVSGIQDVNFT